MEQPKIAAAVGAAANKPEPGKNSIEEAMSDAVAKAQAEGITDTEEIRKRMMEARKNARR